MKVTLDLDRLLSEGHITAEERERLATLAAKDTSSLALNVLIGFGVVAAAGAVAALTGSGAIHALVPLGIALAGTGVYLDREHRERSRPLGTILLLVGSLAGGAGIVVLAEGTAPAFALVAVGFGVGALLARSGLLAALFALALLSAAGGSTGYGGAAYFLGIGHPALTVALFGVLSFAAYQLSLLLPGDYAGIAIIFSRTSLLIATPEPS